MARSAVLALGAAAPQSAIAPLGHGAQPCRLAVSAAPRETPPLAASVVAALLQLQSIGEADSRSAGESFRAEMVCEDEAFRLAQAQVTKLPPIANADPPVVTPPPPTAEQIATPAIVGLVREQLAELRQPPSPAPSTAVPGPDPASQSRAAARDLTSLKMLVNAQAALAMIQATQLDLILYRATELYGTERRFAYGF